MPHATGAVALKVLQSVAAQPGHAPQLPCVHSGEGGAAEGSSGAQQGGPWEARRWRRTWEVLRWRSTGDVIATAGGQQRQVDCRCIVCVLKLLMPHSSRSGAGLEVVQCPLNFIEWVRPPQILGMGILLPLAYAGPTARLPDEAFPPMGPPLAGLFPTRRRPMRDDAGSKRLSRPLSGVAPAPGLPLHPVSAATVAAACIATRF